MSDGVSCSIRRSRDARDARPPVRHKPYLTIPTDKGMQVEGGRALLAELLAHATQPRFVYSHRWQAGDLVMWDNRCLLHRATDDFDFTAHPRTLHRTVLRGSVPR